ncbi:MAG: amidase, partial [Candidatus Bathyarchaeia archaeon]
MDSGELCQSSIGKLADLIKRREITVSDVVKAVLHRIQTVNPRINAYITVLSDEAVEVSRELDDVIRRGKHRGMLHGVPFAAKDIFATRGVLTSAASKILVENIPDHDATSVARLREEGAVLIGKQNLHEFAYGPTSEESHYGPCRNPWNTEMVSGGSSGGSAAAVAAGICHGALGSDTGGSIRIPASLCGVVGLKPTYGRISRYGVIPLSWSLDHVGVITRTVEDAALMLETVSGKDPHDPTCSNRPTPKLAPHLSEDVTGIKAAVLKQFMDECVDAKVRKAVETAIGAVEKLGVEVEEITVPNVEHTAGVTNMLMACEATSVHEEWLKTRVNEYQPSVSTRLQVGYFYTSMHYIKALKVREWFRREFA